MSHISPFHLSPPAPGLSSAPGTRPTPAPNPQGTAWNGAEQGSKPPEQTHHQDGTRTDPEFPGFHKTHGDPTGRETAAEFGAGWQTQGLITKEVSPKNTTKEFVRASAPLSAG